MQLKPLAPAVLVWRWSCGRTAADDLPPPPSAISMPDTTLYLEPVNGRQTGKWCRSPTGGHYYLTPQQLSDAGCRWRTSERNRRRSIDKVDVTYSGETQQLLISVLNDWLPKQTLGDANPEQRLPAQSSLASC